MSNIKLFESKQVRSQYNQEEENWYFVFQGIVTTLTDSKDVKQYIKRMLNRDEILKNNWGTICTLVEMKAAGEIVTITFCNRLKILLKSFLVLSYRQFVDN